MNTFGEAFVGDICLVVLLFKAGLTVLGSQVCDMPVFFELGNSFVSLVASALTLACDALLPFLETANAVMIPVLYY